MIDQNATNQPNNHIGLVKVALQNIIQSLDKHQQDVRQYLQQAQTSISEVREHLISIHKQIGKMPESRQEEKKVGQQQILNHLFGFLFELLVSQDIEKIEDKKKMAIRFLQVQSKMGVVPQFLQSAVTMQPDITTTNLVNYKKVFKKTILVQNDFIQRNKILQHYRQLQRIMRVTTAAVITENRSNYCFFQKIIFGFSYPRFMIASDQCLLRCYSLWRNPNAEMVNNIWDLPERGAIKHCKAITYPSIKTNFYIHIPTKVKDKRVRGNYNIFQQNEEDQTVPVLVLHNEEFDYRDEKYQPCSCCPCLGTSNFQQIETIIVYIHGGGFIALTSSTMQPLTRRWSKELNVPIFCIDYRQPPQFRFPTGLQDCLHVYEFITQHIHNYFNIRPKNIVLAGDSAGGNFACSLEALILRNRMIAPIGMFLAYPAVDVRQRYSPSRLNSFNDGILFPSFLLLCLKQYLGKNMENQFHPLASPLLLTEKFIHENSEDEGWPKQWPKTVIMVGKNDPLYDDSLRLMQRLVERDIDAKLYIYQNFSHAFLSVDFVVSECEEAIRKSVEELRELLQGGK